MLRHGLADVGECRANAERGRTRHAVHASVDRYALARVICAAPRRVAAVIGGEHEQVAVAHHGQRLRHARIECFQRCRVARNVAPVAEIGVEVDEVGEHQVAVARIVHGGERRIEQRHVAGALAHLADAAMGEDVADLADADDRAAHRREPVADRVFRRRYRIVAPVRRPFEVFRIGAKEGAGDHPADIEWIDQFAHRLAEAVEPLQPEGFLVRGDLQDGIGGCVADRHAGTQMLLAQVLDDRRARCMAIAENAGDAGALDDGLGQVFRECRHRVGKIGPVERHRIARDFPVAGRRVLAGGGLLCGAEEAVQMLHGRLRQARFREARRVGEAEPVHHRQGKRAGTQAVAVAVSARAALQDVAVGVGPLVAESRGVGRIAYTEGVQHKKKRTRHGRTRRINHDRHIGITGRRKPLCASAG